METIRGKEYLLNWNGSRINRGILDMLEDALEEMTDKLAASASALAPLGDTGELQDSIGTQVIRTNKDVNGYIGVKENSDAEDYAARIEFGFNGKDSAGRNIKQGARPFLRPVLKTSKGKVAAILKRKSRAKLG